MLIYAAASSAVAAYRRYTTPVDQVAPILLDVPYCGGVTKFPVYISTDWTRRQTGVKRAVLVFHGLHRNAGSYYTGALKAGDAAGEASVHVIMIARQFLADFDIPAHALPADALGWPGTAGPGGEPASTPAPLSGFDAVLSRLFDRTIFPNLTTVVIAGFSAGGQIVQRYAVVGQGEQLLPANTTVQYVVSDPSSYLYFTPDRPDASGHPAPVAAATYPDRNNWHYGFADGVPPYVHGTPSSLESRYAHRNVTYLLGTADTDPHHPVLDKSCAAKAESPQRFARGHAYFATMQARDGMILKQRLIDVPGIAHRATGCSTRPAACTCCLETKLS